MKSLRRNFERFCARNSNKGIPNLMLYIAVGNAIVYLFSLFDPSNLLYSVLCFNVQKILHGQLWRLLTYIFVPSDFMGGGPFGILLLAIMLFFYFQIGRMLESRWGTLKFNLYYLTGILVTDLAALLLRVNVSNYYLDLSLILSFATLFPNNRVLLFMIIPIKMKYLAWFYFAYTIFEMIQTPFPYLFFPLFALANYFLFFGADVLEVLPDALRYRRPRRVRNNTYTPPKAKPSPNWANGYQSKSGEKPYRHKCTVCGRTDTEYPDMEFRYCSRCNGYYCYCEEHINHHAHIS